METGALFQEHRYCSLQTIPIRQMLVHEYFCVSDLPRPHATHENQFHHIKIHLPEYRADAKEAP